MPTWDFNAVVFSIHGFHFLRVLRYDAILFPRSMSRRIHSRLYTLLCVCSGCASVNSLEAEGLEKNAPAVAFIFQRFYSTLSYLFFDIVASGLLAVAWHRSLFFLHFSFIKEKSSSSSSSLHRTMKEILLLSQPSYLVSPRTSTKFVRSTEYRVFVILFQRIIHLFSFPFERGIIITRAWNIGFVYTNIEKVKINYCYRCYPCILNCFKFL